MIALMYTRLIDISGTAERGGVALQHAHSIPARCAEKRSIQAVQPRADDYSVISVHTFSGAAGKAAAQSVYFFSLFAMEYEKIIVTMERAAAVPMSMAS